MIRAILKDIPPLRDARWIQIGALLTYSIISREIFHIERSHWVSLTCVLLAVFLDLVFGKLKYKVWRFPFSAIIIGLSCNILLDSKSPAFYIIAVILASLSKAFLTADGKHFYNPSNFGVVIVLQLLAGWGIGSQRIFAGYWVPSALFFLIGVLTVLRARQCMVSFAWMGGFIFFAVLRTWLLGTDPVLSLGPALSPAFMIFTFHMISDPATTPRTSGLQLFFGIATALLDAGFRSMEIPYGQFYALFIVSSSLPFLRLLESQKASYLKDSSNWFKFFRNFSMGSLS